MPIDTSDIRGNNVSLHAYDTPPRVIRRNTNTVVLELAQDEVLTLITDLAKSAWAGDTHLVVEADVITYPNIEIDAPTEVFQQGYEAAIEDMKQGMLGPLYVTGLFDEHEFMQQRPPHALHAHGPFTDLDAAIANARTLSSDPDEAVVIEVKAPQGDVMNADQAFTEAYAQGISDAREALNADQRDVIARFETLLTNAAINTNYASALRALLYKACENARHIGRLERRDRERSGTRLPSA